MENKAVSIALGIILLCTILFAYGVKIAVLTEDHYQLEDWVFSSKYEVTDFMPTYYYICGDGDYGSETWHYRGESFTRSDGKFCWYNGTRLQKFNMTVRRIN